jgi:DNA-binding CsgD family transcriptional regulator
MKDEEILKLICSDLSAKEIGAIVGKSAKQVQSRIGELSHQKKVRTRYGLMMWSLKNKIGEI